MRSLPGVTAGDRHSSHFRVLLAAVAALAGYLRRASHRSDDGAVADSALAGCSTEGMAITCVYAERRIPRGAVFLLELRCWRDRAAELNSAPGTVASARWTLRRIVLGSSNCARSPPTSAPHRPAAVLKLLRPGRLFAARLTASKDRADTVFRRAC